MNRALSCSIPLVLMLFVTLAAQQAARPRLPGLQPLRLRARREGGGLRRFLAGVDRRFPGEVEHQRRR